ncbi:MAG: Uma2 family endonuclease [Gemmatimonadaceae bacterium]
MAITVPRYTVDDLEQFPADGNRYELLDGMLLVTPAPSAAHQIVANHIQARLTALVQWPGYANVVGPGAMVVPPRTQLQPDILVYPARFGPRVDWAKVSEHWLAVEVLSRSSRVYDREFKRNAYFALGVPALWLVDHRDRSVEVWRSRDVPEVVRDLIRWSVPTLDLIATVDLASVFAGLD